jgi:AcrR family transcriptional regulator
VARAEFAEKGLSGARVDEIAARTATSKRMIYYYFADKEGLYRAVLEEAYADLRAAERGLNLSGLTPPEALRTLAGFLFDHHSDNPDFVRLVAIENIHRARHLTTSRVVSDLNLSAIALVRELYERGVREGCFRPGLEPRDLHLTMSALAFYNVANRYTIRELFGHDMMTPQARAMRRTVVIETISRYVAAP